MANLSRFSLFALRRNPLKQGLFVGLQVVKRLWEYIKANNLQNPEDRRQILLDDKLKTIFPGNSVQMFKMNKHLSKHCKVDGECNEQVQR